MSQRNSSTCYFFVCYLATKFKFSSIKSKIFSVTWFHKLFFIDPHEVIGSMIVRQVRRGLKVFFGFQPKDKVPLTFWHVSLLAKYILLKYPDSVDHMCILVSLILGVSACYRTSVFASPTLFPSIYDLKTQTWGKVLWYFQDGGGFGTGMLMTALLSVSPPIF